MPRPRITTRLAPRILASVAMATLVPLLAPTPSYAQSPYAYEDLTENFDSPFDEVQATNFGSTPQGDVAVIASQSPIDTLPVVNAIGDPASGVSDLPPEVSVDPAPDAVSPLRGDSLPKTGGEVLERICLAMLLASAGLLAAEAGRRRRRVWAT